MKVGRDLIKGDAEIFQPDGGLSPQLPYTRHHVLDDWLDVVGRQKKVVCLSYYTDGLTCAVDDNLASLALAQVLLNAGLDLWLGAALEVVSEFGKEVSAAKHCGRLRLY